MGQKLIPASVLIFLGMIFFGVAYAQTSNPTTFGPEMPSDHLVVNINTAEGEKEILRLPVDKLLFNIMPHYDYQGNLLSITMKLKPDLTDTYQKIGLFNKTKDIVFVYPIFTQAAYGKNGFYDYYNKKCDTSCLTVTIPDKINGIYSSSISGALALKLLQYPHLTDVDVDKNPDILKQYKRVIILHNEYVTKKEFDAITNHPDVVFLYPNALYAQVDANYTSNTITLVRGHGYPDTRVRNGFDWKYDNSKYEYNVKCDEWTFYRHENYSMMNCYPDYRLLIAPEIYNLLQVSDPTQLLEDMTNWVRYPTDQQYAKNLLADYDITGTHIPHWVIFPAVMTLNGDMTKSEFLEILDYLYKGNTIQ